MRDHTSDFLFYFIFYSSRTDTSNELELLKKASVQFGAFSAVVADHWSQGGEGALDLADAIIAASKQNMSFRLDILYSKYLL